MRPLSLFLCVTLAFGQQVGTNVKPDSGPTTFTSNTQLVIETVVVKDKSGKAITGLTEKDFDEADAGDASDCRSQ